MLWCHSHLVWLVFEGSIPTCTCFHLENFINIGVIPHTFALTMIEEFSINVGKPFYLNLNPLSIYAEPNQPLKKKVFEFEPCRSNKPCYSLAGWIIPWFILLGIVAICLVTGAALCITGVEMVSNPPSGSK